MIDERDLPEEDGQEEGGEEQELYEHYRFVVDRGQGLLRIDKYVASRIENASRNKVQMAAKAGNILVNDLPVKSNYKVKPGDVISIVMAYPPREIELIPQDIPLNILYEDEDLIVINKEAGLVVHPAYGNYSGTLVNALVHRFGNLPRQNDEDIKPGLVHRLDKNTSGIMVVAKTEIAQTRLAKLFFDRKIDRIYNALVWGDFQEDEGTITGHIGRSLKNRKVMDVFPDGDYGKHAITHYRVLERFGYVTLVECKLETGRTHQIRAHFQHIGHPLFNDETYGGDRILKGTTFTKYKQFVNNCFNLLPRHALHAKTLGFKHPTTGKPLFFDSELPEDMLAVLEKWRNYSIHRKWEDEPSGTDETIPEKPPKTEDTE
ncbi:MAG: RluA family pseudouridine synthase [Bacteroides sp.]|jgi:23S rRNA pseudouridine1911/1915/1917 synthase|nr:RluA family pseudouridine synthase [Bacteroides sp.]